MIQNVSTYQCSVARASLLWRSHILNLTPKGDVLPVKAESGSLDPPDKLVLAQQNRCQM